jgi:hypothetical protein
VFCPTALSAFLKIRTLKKVLKKRNSITLFSLRITSSADNYTILKGESRVMSIVTIIILPVIFFVLTIEVGIPLYIRFTGQTAGIITEKIYSYRYQVIIAIQNIEEDNKEETENPIKNIRETYISPFSEELKKLDKKIKENRLAYSFSEIAYLKNLQNKLKQIQDLEYEIELVKIYKEENLYKAIMNNAITLLKEIDQQIESEYQKRLLQIQNRKEKYTSITITKIREKYKNSKQ